MGGTSPHLTVTDDTSFDGIFTAAPVTEIISHSTTAKPAAAVARAIQAAPTLLLYLFAASDRFYRDNLEYFIKHGITEGDGVDYVIIVQKVWPKARGLSVAPLEITVFHTCSLLMCSQMDIYASGLVFKRVSQIKKSRINTPTFHEARRFIIMQPFSVKIAANHTFKCCAINFTGIPVFW